MNLVSLLIATSVVKYSHNPGLRTGVALVAIAHRGGRGRDLQAALRQRGRGGPPADERVPAGRRGPDGGAQRPGMAAGATRTAGRGYGSPAAGDRLAARPRAARAANTAG